MMGFARRYWLLIAVAIFVAWLGATSHSGTSLRNDIHSAFKNGHFGGLDSNQNDALAILVKRSLIAAGMEPNFAINAKVRSDRLDVLTFDSNLSDYPTLSALRPGNAAYNPQLDALFLDLKQVTSALTVSELDPFTDAGKMFLVMTILHELGHRKFDGGTLGRLNLITDLINEREQRADAFAHEIMAGWTASDTHQFSDIWGNGRETAGLFAFMSIATVSARAQTKTDFGSYYTSNTHSRLIDRLLAFLEKLYAASQGRDQLNKEIAFAQTAIAGAGSSAGILCELRTVSPIRYLTWSNDKLWVLSDDYVYHIKVSDILSCARATEYCLIHLDILANHPKPPQAVVAGTFNEFGVINILTEEGRVWVKEGDRWKNILDTGKTFWHSPTTGSVSNPTIHRRDARSATIWKDTSDSILHLGTAGPIQFNLQGVANNLDWVLVAAHSEGFVLAPSHVIGGGDDNTLTLLSIDCRKQCKVAKKLRFLVNGLPSTTFNVIASSDSTEFYLTTSHTRIGVLNEMQLWRIFEDKPPNHIAQSPLLQKRASEANLVFYERLYQSRFRWGLATPTHVYINYVGGDPVLKVNVESGVVEQPFLQSDLFSYHVGEELMALSDRTTANIENNAFSIMIID